MEIKILLLTAMAVISASLSCADTRIANNFWEISTHPAKGDYLNTVRGACSDCERVLSDLIDIGAIDNTMGAVIEELDRGEDYPFRIGLIIGSRDYYDAVHFWEMNMLNRHASNQEILSWVKTDEATLLVEYFQLNRSF